MTDAGLRLLVSAHGPTLEELRVAFCRRISLRGLEEIVPDAIALRVLDMRVSQGVGEVGMADGVLHALVLCHPPLEELDIRGLAFNSATLVRLGAACEASLTTLLFTGRGHSSIMIGSELIEFARLASSLRSLYIGHTDELAPAVVANIVTNFANLRHLKMEGLAVSRVAGLELVVPHLVSLQLVSVLINDADLAEMLAGCRMLQLLRLVNCTYISEEWIGPGLVHLAELRRMIINGCPIGDGAIAVICELRAHLRHLTLLNVTHTNLTEASLPMLESMAHGGVVVECADCADVPGLVLVDFYKRTSTLRPPRATRRLIRAGTN